MRNSDPWILSNLAKVTVRIERVAHIHFYSVFLKKTKIYENARSTKGRGFINIFYVDSRYDIIYNKAYY